MKFTQRKSGDQRTTLRVDFHLSAEELAGALYVHVYNFEMIEDLPEKMPEAKIIERVKASLSFRGEECLYPEDKEEEYWDWCVSQIERITGLTIG